MINEIKRLLKLTFELKIKTLWLKTIDKELKKKDKYEQKASKFNDKAQKSRYVIGELMKEYNKKWGEKDNV